MIRNPHLFAYLGNGIFCFKNSKRNAFLFTTSEVLKEYPSTFHPDLANEYPTCFKEGTSQALLTCRDSYGDTIYILDQDGTF